MPQLKTDITGCLGLIDELVRLTAPPAGEREIGEQGLAVLAKALNASGGALFLRAAAGEAATEGPASATWGSAVREDLAPVADRAMRTFDVVEERRSGGAASRVAMPLPGPSGPIGAVVLQDPADWTAEGKSFARSAARTISASLLSARMLQESRRQGELLARRNVELETLRELAGRVQERGSEEEMLQAALDLVLEKLGLESGWIFWGEAERKRLELAASRGVAEAFLRRARDSGIGECLCQDVFATGSLKMARNTVDCPRLPDLVCAGEPMTHACIPLKFERGTLGVMNIANRPGQLFTRQELQFLETVGQQVCLAVDKARTARGESRHNAEARALAALTLAIGGSLDQEKVLAAVGEYGRELLAADRCAIYLGDGSAPPLFAYLSGPPLAGVKVGSHVDFQALGSRAVLGALASRKTLVVPDALNDPRVNADLARRWEIRSTIIVPLVAHGRMEGVLAADRSRPSSWSPEDVDLASALAGQGALAIENARLYREAQEAFLGLQRAQYGMMRAERLAAVGTLASSLAHEVRNPLNSISLQLVLLSRRLKRLEDPMQTEIASLIESARSEITRLDGLVEEFLSLSTLDRVSLSETHPHEVLQEVVALMGPVARLKGIMVVEDLGGGLPVLRLDREKMKQVLINLIRNAIEAMPRGGTLTLSTRTEKDLVIVQVADTGVGIEPGLDIFDFFITTKHDGTGLGLPIARRIVEAHGGTLTYDSAPGRGATFRVTLKRPDGNGDPAGFGEGGEA